LKKFRKLQQERRISKIISLLLANDKVFHLQILKVHTLDNMYEMCESRIMCGVKLRWLGRDMKKIVTCITYFVINVLGYQEVQLMA
jgi:hypothetical protein